MYISSDILSEFQSLIGWRDDDFNYHIAKDLQKSDSGLFFNDKHPLLTIGNLHQVAPDFYKKDYEEWDPAREYYGGEIAAMVLDSKDRPTKDEKDAGFAIYRALRDNSGEKPRATSAWWRVDPFSEWLRQKTDAFILQAVSRFYNESLSSQTATDLFLNDTLIDGVGRFKDIIPNSADMVGFMIAPARRFGVTIEIPQLGLQFSKDADITFRLYHSSKMAPLRTFKLSYRGGGSFQWFALNEPILLKYMDDGTDSGGCYYLLYDQTELPAGCFAINKAHDWSRVPCQSCSRREYSSYINYSPYVSFFGLKVESEAVQEHGINPDETLYTYRQNFGLNAVVSGHCDLTDTLIRNKQAFTQVISLQVAAGFLRMMALNPNWRINRSNQSMKPEEVLYEIDGDSTGYKKSGLGYELETAFKGLHVNMEGLDSLCLPCAQDGLLFGTI